MQRISDGAKQPSDATGGRKRPKTARVLNKMPIADWVMRTVGCINASGADGVEAWIECWGKAYDDLGGRSPETRKKGCPRAGAYGLWWLGRIKGGNRPYLNWSEQQVQDRLGKNVTYAVIALDLLAKGLDPDNVDHLWAAVKDRYAALFGETVAENEQGEVRIAAALFAEGQVVARPTGTNI